MTHTTCRELIEFLHDYVAGEVPPARVAEFERHLAICVSCVEYVKSYRETIFLARATADDVEDVPAELLTAILATIARDSGG